MIASACANGEPATPASVATMLMSYVPEGTAPFVAKFDPTIWNCDAFVPLSDREPENAGEDGDIVTLIAPTTVPDAAPPVKVLFERLTAVMACPAVTLMARFADVLASHDVVGTARAAKDSKKIGKRRMLIPLTAWRRWSRSGPYSRPRIIPVRTD